MTSRLVISLILACLCVAVGLAIPKLDGKNRVIDNSLSDQEHFVNEDHNPDYDHEAFLGAEEAKTFDELTPEESRERLKKIVDKMDGDGDALITFEELKDWIRATQKKYVVEDVDRQWSAHNPSNNESLTWEEYRKSSYGFLDDSSDDDVVEEDGYSYKDMMRRDKRRWDSADEDHDGQLTKDEYMNFLHPEDAVHMRDIVIQETMEDIDKDNDGKVSLAEYIGDMYREETEGEEPDWVRNERDQFVQHRDKDGDGFMDKEEVQAWIMPQDYDHAEAEAKHLIYESDKDKDNKLTKDEILDKYDLFVGSQATDFGEALTRHDEF